MRLFTNAKLKPRKLAIARLAIFYFAFNVKNLLLHLLPVNNNCYFLHKTQDKPKSTNAYRSSIPTSARTADRYCHHGEQGTLDRLPSNS